MTIGDVKEALVAIMQTEFPPEHYNYYSMQVIEGYARPCFFTQIKPVELSPVNYNTRKTEVMFYITYMQDVVDEEEIYDTIQKIRDLFGLAVNVKDRWAKVGNFDYDFIGTDRNVTEMSIELSWADAIAHPDDHDIMETLELNEEVEE